MAQRDKPGIRIIVADDHPIVRAGLREIIARERDMSIAAEAQTSQEVFEALARQPADVLILDVMMPGRGGMEVVKLLRQERPELPVLILSVFPEDQLAVRALRAGAAGYLTKDSATAELVGAIRKVVGGGKYVSPSVAEKLARELSGHAGQAPHDKLSDREYQILRMIVKGKTVGDIAEELALSVKTISTYRTRMMEKLNVKTTADLVRYALAERLVE
jgi:two-component system, NarL family, invasion response regulator UvrY